METIEVTPAQFIAERAKIEDEHQSECDDRRCKEIKTNMAQEILTLRYQLRAAVEGRRLEFLYGGGA